MRVEPLELRGLGQKHRHAVMDEGDGGGRLTGQDEKLRLSIPDAIDPCHVDDAAPRRADCIFGLFLAAPLPFEIVACGNQATPMQHS